MFFYKFSGGLIYSLLLNRIVQSNNNYIYVGEGGWAPFGTQILLCLCRMTNTFINFYYAFHLNGGPLVTVTGDSRVEPQIGPRLQ